MSPRSGRLASLDAFRGLTIAGMILVDNPGNWTSVLAPLSHAEWNGCSLADLVFPWFLFILGAAMPFAFARRQQGSGAATIHRRIIRRTFALIVLGLILNGVAAWSTRSAFRIPGVLQRIGLVYGAAALIFLHTPKRYRSVLTAGLLLIHWAALEMPTWTGAFDLSPTQNVSAAIDRAVFGHHLLTIANDPEGLLGLLSATATALIGTVVGDCLRRERGLEPGRLALAGLGLAAAGLGWSRLLPLNKALWTGSYALFASGAAMLPLAAFHRALDRGAEPLWTRPLLWLGLNPLAIYFASEVVRQLLDRPLAAVPTTTTAASWLFWSVLRPIVPGRLGDEWVALVYGALVVIAWTIAAGGLHRQEVRFQV